MQCFLCPALDYMLDGETPPPAFNPNDISSILQNLGSPLTYRSSLLSGLPVIESSVGASAAVPRGQRCVLFDGGNDFAISSANVEIKGEYTFAAWIKPNDANAVVEVLVTNATSGSFLDFVVDINRTAGKVSVLNNGAAVIAVSTSSFTANAWVHVAVVRSGSAGSWTVKIYLNGVLDSTHTTAQNPDAGANPKLQIGGASTFGNYYSGRMNDARLYSEPLDAARILAISNQHTTPTTLDRTGLLGAWWLQEEAGTVHYDWSGNGNDLTATNVDTASYHATDAGVKYNAANELGHTLSGSVVIPRNEADISKDAAGGALQFAGPVKLPVVVEVPCVTGDGSAVHAAIGSALFPTTGDFSASAVAINVPTATGNHALFFQTGNDFLVYYAGHAGWGLYLGGAFVITGVGGDCQGLTVAVSVSRSGTTFTLSVVKNGVTFSSTGTSAASLSNGAVTLLKSGFGQFFSGGIADFRITTGGVTTTFPLQEGPGSSNTNRNIHFVKSDGTGGVVTNAIVNGTVANIWANRTNVVRDWAIENGGGIAANGAFVPGIPGSANDAAGNVKTLAVGKHGNPYSRLLQNHFSAPSLVNIGSTSSDKYAPGYDVQAETTADTRARRTAASGDDRYVAFREVLTGADLTNVEEWVQ